MACLLQPPNCTDCWFQVWRALQNLPSSAPLIRFLGLGLWILLTMSLTRLFVGQDLNLSLNVREQTRPTSYFCPVTFLLHCSLMTESLRISYGKIQINVKQATVTQADIQTDFVTCSRCCDSESGRPRWARHAAMVVANRLENGNLEDRDENGSITSTRTQRREHNKTTGRPWF
jgi:hypothetical protein